MRAIRARNGPASLWNLLKILLVLDEERNFQRAAARLFVTPSAISHALARLRQALADPLFCALGGPSQNDVDGRLAREGRQRPIVVSVPGYGAVGDLLRATSLVATMPDRTALAIMSNHPDLCLVRITPVIRTPLSIEISARCRSSPAGSWFHCQLLKCAAEVPHL